MITAAARPSGRIRLLFAFLALCLAVVGVVATGVVPAQATDACGTVQATANGVDVMSNGANQGTGYSCGSPNGEQNTAPTPSGGTVTTGYMWQCVEFANRYYAMKGWISSRWSGNGSTLKDNLPSGLTFTADGSITSIVVGDAVTYTGGSAGHVGVVSAVSGNTVTIANQNISGAVYGTATYNPATKTLSSEFSGLTTQGIVHATNNSNSASSTVRTISTSDGHIQSFKISGGALSENWYNPSDGTTGTWTQPVAPPSQAAGTPAVVQRPGQNVIDAFVRGSNSQVYATWYDFQHGTWGGWVGMGGGPNGFTSDPQVQPTSDGNYQVFGTGGGYVEQTWYSPSGSHGVWTTSAGLGASAVGSPALALRSGQNVIDAFVRGGNNQVYTTWYNFQYGNWGGWIGIGGGPLGFTSDPQVVTTSDGHDQIFGTGGGYVEQNWFSPNGSYGAWTTSAGLGASAVGTPAMALRSGQNVMDAFVRGSNNQVYATWYDFQHGNWGGWVGMGGGPNGFTTDPQVQETSDGHDQIFGTGPGYVEENWYNPSNGYYGGWRTM